MIYASCALHVLDTPTRHPCCYSCCCCFYCELQIIVLHFFICSSCTNNYYLHHIHRDRFRHHPTHKMVSCSLYCKQKPRCNNECGRNICSFSAHSLASFPTLWFTTDIVT